MKNSILFLAAIVYANIASAQTISVTREKATFSTGEQNAVVTTIYQNTKDEVVDKWKDYLKNFKNEKVKFSDDELFGDDVLIKDLGKIPMDVYTRFDENKKDKTVKMMVAFNSGGAWLSAAGEPDQFAAAEKLVKDFASNTTKTVLEEKLKDLQKILVSLEDEQRNMERDNKNLQNDIENYKKKISQAEEDSKKNNDNQAKKKAQIDAQKSAIDLIKHNLDEIK